MVPKSQLGFSQSQKIIMVPALKQAIKILQYPILELQEVIKQELLENPFLEEVSLQEDIDYSQEIQSKEDDFRSEDFREFITFESDDSSRDDSSEDEFSSNGHNIITKQQTLSEFLLEQLRLSNVTTDGYKIGEIIIGNIDENGYLKLILEDIVNLIGNNNVAEIENVIKLIQTFDPPGVAARDLRECLLIQIKEKGLENTLAEKILREFWDEFKKRHYNNIAKTCGVSIEDVHNAFQNILNLNPKPGRNFGFFVDNLITPDVIVEKINEKYIVKVNDDGLLKLRINRFYKNLLNKEINLETKEYMNVKLQEAYSIIKGIEERKKNLLKVSEIIVDIQKDFLDNGIGYLKPLILKDVAVKVNLHESTVSRLIANKYVETPEGFIPFKVFFSTKIPKINGPNLSSSSIKKTIKELIESEDHANPLSDKKIVEELFKTGVKLARRTVAKYREEMNIQSSSIRNESF